MGVDRAPFLPSFFTHHNNKWKDHLERGEREREREEDAEPACQKKRLFGCVLLLG
jgi:hypothetical protein